MVGQWISPTCTDNLVKPPMNDFHWYGNTGLYTTASIHSCSGRPLAIQMHEGLRLACVATIVLQKH